MNERAENRASGIVKWFDSGKGYGFITPVSGGTDIFVHASELNSAGISTLTQGNRVSYVIVSNRGRSSAGQLLLEAGI